MSTEKKIGISNGDRAHVLVQAMPYIKKWAGETIVVKYGGNAMINPELKEAVMNDIVLMQLVGINVVLVHGGGPEISAMLKKIGKESRFVNGMRYTDGETMDIVQQVLAGKPPLPTGWRPPPAHRRAFWGICAAAPAPTH